MRHELSYSKPISEVVVKNHPAGSDESLSLWIDTTPSTNYPSFRGEVDADVAIVGAGITGITAAYLLSKAGRSVVLVDKGRMAMSETGHTTAHIFENTVVGDVQNAEQDGRCEEMVPPTSASSAAQDRSSRAR